MPVGLHMALYKAFHAQKNRTRPGMMAIGLSPGQPKVLHYLTRHDNCMQKDIAYALDIEPATVSRLLDNMAQAGMIRRAEPGENRRAESVTITGAGREACARWDVLCAEVEADALRDFSAQEKEQFIGYLCRMYWNLTGKPAE